MVTAWLTDREGKLVGKGVAEPVTVGPHESRMGKQTIALAHPVLVSPENPYLYRAGATIQSGGVVADEQKLRIGVREIHIDETGLYVNGVYTKIKGVNNHQD